MIAAEVAAGYGFSRADILELDDQELTFWHEKLTQIAPREETAPPW